MSIIKFKVAITEINMYDFQIEVSDSISIEDQRLLAEAKLRLFLDTQCPNPYQRKSVNGVLCCDREAGYETLAVKSVIPIG